MNNLPQDLVKALDKYFSYKRIRRGYTDGRLWLYFIPTTEIPQWGVGKGSEIVTWDKEYFDLGKTYSGCRLAWNYVVKREINGLYVQCVTIPCSVKLVLQDPITGKTYR